MVQRSTTIMIFIIFASLIPQIAHGEGALITGSLMAPPERILKETNAPMPTVGGIPFSYAGYLDYSNSDGSFTIPKHHPDNTNIRIVITPGVRFVKAKGETISHLTIDQSKPIKVYRFTKQQDEKQDWFWKAQEEDIPGDGKVYSTDLIIFANPQNIFVDVKTAFMTSDSNQIILPLKSIYVLATSKIDMIDLQKNFQMIEASKSMVAATKEQEQAVDVTAVDSQ